MENCTNTTLEAPWTMIGRRFELLDGIKCFLILIGIIGNSLVIYVQCRLKNARFGEAKSTNRLIICLATADILTAVLLTPIPEFGNIPRNAVGKFYCHAVGSRYFLWVSFRASGYTLTTIAIERFLAIVYPFTYRRLVKSKYVGFAIATIWICPLLLRFPQFYFYSVDDCGRCSIDFPTERPGTGRIYRIILFITDFLCPVIIITYTSIRVVFVLRRNAGVHHAKAVRPWFRRGCSPRQRTTPMTSMTPLTPTTSSCRRLSIMFFFICIAFLVLWAPDQIGVLLFYTGILPREYIGSEVYRICLTVAFLNAVTANPIIYSVCLPSFRHAVKDTLKCRSRDRSHTPIMLVNSISVTPS